jgi:tetratricopeptide (TPR) repeat protein
MRDGWRTVAEDWLREAEAAFADDDPARALDLAGRGLATTPDDLDLLRVAARAALESDPALAAAHLRRLVALAPDDADGWRDLGSALVEEGDLAGAADALRAAVRLRADDVGSLVDLAHALFAMGHSTEALETLSRAREQDPHHVGILRSMVEMYRVGGQAQAALDCARLLVAERPDDVLALLDIADQLLVMGNVDEAFQTFDRVRRTDADEDHEVYCYHGMIEALVRRNRWRQALEVAIDATRVDRHQLTTDLLAFITAQLFGERESLRPGSDAAAAPPGTPARADIEGALAEARALHRRLHAEVLAA